MSELLNIIESMQAEAATTEKLFGREGVKAQTTVAKMDPATKREGLRIIDGALKGNTRDILTFQEAMTTSDFSNLFGDVLDRQLLGGYQSLPTTYQQYLRVGQVRDFRTVKRFYVNGAEAVLTAVAEQEEYPEAGLSDGKYSYAVQKYGRRLPFSWETFINDDLGAFMDSVERLGIAARRTEEKFATQLFAGTTGPNGTFFASGNFNVMATPANPLLSLTAMQAAFTLLSNQRDADGEPIFIDTVFLVVPPALAVVANNRVNATELWLTEQPGSTTNQVHVGNWMRGKVNVIVNYYLPIISTTNGATSWYMFASPGAGRPAAEIGFLRGNREPAIFVKNPNAIRIGGCSDPMDGDFDTDTIEYKVRHVMGGTLMDPKMAVASNGTGS